MVKEQILRFVCRICHNKPFDLYRENISMKSVNSMSTARCQNSPDSSPSHTKLKDNCNSRCHNVESVQIGTFKQQLLNPRRFLSTGWKTCFLFSLIVLLLAVVPNMANPLPASSGSLEHHRHHKDHSTRLHSRPAKFINPCRLPATVPNLEGGADIQTQPDVEIFHNIITQSTKALRQAQEFIDEFYKNAFGVERNSDTKYDDIRYDFLADTTEKINQFNNDQLSNLNVEEQIKFLYQSLQKFAVGLEAIVLDQACYGQQFYHHFNEAEYQLKYVLCELQIAMLEKNIEYTDITRDIMSQEYRDIEDKTVRNIRDYVIFRDYVKALEYVNTTFQFFHDRAQQQAL